MKRCAIFVMAVFALAWISGQSLGGGEGTEVTLDGLKSRAPAAWKAQKPASKLRAYQFLLPRVEGDPADAELAIFFFGAGGGGGVDDNIKRWKSQFQPPEGKTADEAAKVEKLTVGKVAVTYLDVQGTYLFKPPFDPNAKAKALPDYRRFGIIFASENGPYFITLTGPAKTMAHHKKDFDNWLKAFK